jgi:hypothetical protein
MSDSSDQPDPKHLSNRHRDALTQIYQHPVSHNVRWSDVVSLLNAVGTVDEQHNGRLKVHIGDETEVFDPPHGDDATEQQIVDLRRMLRSAGLEPTKPGHED